MKPGSIEYSPDYKPKKRYPAGTEVFQRLQRRAERMRLEHGIAVNFGKWRKEGNPFVQQQYWLAMIEASTRLEVLDEQN